VIDAQKIYTDPDSEMYSENAKSTIKRINSLVEKFKQNNELIIFVRHVHKLDGTDLGRMFDFTGEAEDDFNFKEGTDEVEYDENLVKPDGSPEIIKNRYSAFFGTALEKRLRNAEIDTVVVCGFMTNFCCESTARDAHDKDFFVDFIIDATGTPGTEKFDQSEVRKIVAELLESGFARIKTTKQYLAGQ
jgi:ureidoacrylate peracid hydrolase